MSKKELELTGEDLGFDIMESDISLADMDVEGIFLTEDARPGMQGVGGGQHGVRDDKHGKEAKDNLPMREHELGQGEVAMTQELLSKLLGAVLAQSPDEGMLETICAGLVSAGNKEDRTLDVADIGMIMGEIKSANAGGGEDAEGDAAYAQGGEPEGGMEEEETCEGCGDDYNEQDRAKGDMEDPKGGAKRHDDKDYQLMDGEGEDELEEAEGSSKPISDNKDKGGKGPGGGSADEYGQKATDEIIPEYPDGSERGSLGPVTDKNEMPPEGSGKNINEAWMAAIPGVMIGSGNPDDPEIADDDPDAELKMIKRRAGMENWWKV